MGKDTLHRDFIKGMRYSQIARLDPDIVKRFDEETLRLATGRLARRGNKLLKMIEDAGMKTPASSWIERNGGKFDSSKKTRNQLLSEFSRARDYLDAETSTIAGYRRVQRKVSRSLAKQDVKITETQYEKFWDSYELLKETNAKVKNAGMKYKVLRHISYMIDHNKRLSAKTIARRIDGMVEEIEKEGVDSERDMDSVSKYFRKPENDSDENILPY